MAKLCWDIPARDARRQARATDRQPHLPRRSRRSAARMKIYTASWFTDLPPTIRRIGISRGTRGVAAGYRVLPELQPGDWFSSALPAEYVERYHAEILQQLDLQALLRRIETLAEGYE